MIRIKTSKVLMSPATEQVEENTTLISSPPNASRKRGTKQVSISEPAATTRKKINRRKKNDGLPSQIRIDKYFKSVSKTYKFDVDIPTTWTKRNNTQRKKRRKLTFEEDKSVENSLAAHECIDLISNSSDEKNCQYNIGSKEDNIGAVYPKESEDTLDCFEVSNRNVSKTKAVKKHSNVPKNLESYTGNCLQENKRNTRSKSTLLSKQSTCKDISKGIQINVQNSLSEVDGKCAKRNSNIKNDICSLPNNSLHKKDATNTQLKTSKTRFSKQLNSAISCNCINNLSGNDSNSVKCLEENGNLLSKQHSTNETGVNKIKVLQAELLEEFNEQEEHTKYSSPRFLERHQQVQRNLVRSDYNDASSSSDENIAKPDLFQNITNDFINSPFQLSTSIIVNCKQNSEFYKANVDKAFTTLKI